MSWAWSRLFPADSRHRHWWWPRAAIVWYFPRLHLLKAALRPCDHLLQSEAKQQKAKQGRQAGSKQGKAKAETNKIRDPNLLNNSWWSYSGMLRIKHIFQHLSSGRSHLALRRHPKLAKVQPHRITPPTASADFWTNSWDLGWAEWYHPWWEAARPLSVCVPVGHQQNTYSHIQGSAGELDSKTVLLSRYSNVPLDTIQFTSLHSLYKWKSEV